MNTGLHPGLELVLVTACAGFLVEVLLWLWAFRKPAFVNLKVNIWPSPEWLSAEYSLSNELGLTCFLLIWGEHAFFTGRTVLIPRL